VSTIAPDAFFTNRIGEAKTFTSSCDEGGAALEPLMLPPLFCGQLAAHSCWLSSPQLLAQPRHAPHITPLMVACHSSSHGPRVSDSVRIFVIQLLEMKRAYINGPAVDQVHRRSHPLVCFAPVPVHILRY
jgi:hypothetical protein